MNHAPSLFLFGAANADQAGLALKSVASLMYGQQNAPDPRDFLGRKIYTIPLPGRRAPGAAAPVSRSLYCAASGGYVALTADVSMLEEYLRSNAGQARPLRETAGLADAAQHVGGAGNGLFGYENQRETMRAAFSLLKNPAATDTAMAAFPEERSGIGWIFRCCRITIRLPNTFTFPSMAAARRRTAFLSRCLRPGRPR